MKHEKKSITKMVFGLLAAFVLAAAIVALGVAVFPESNEPAQARA